MWMELHLPFCNVEQIDPFESGIPCSVSIIWVIFWSSNMLLVSLPLLSFNHAIKYLAIPLGRRVIRIWCAFPLAIHVAYNRGSNTSEEVHDGMFRDDMFTHSFVWWQMLSMRHWYCSQSVLHCTYISAVYSTTRYRSWLYFILQYELNDTISLLLEQNTEHKNSSK